MEFEVFAQKVHAKFRAMLAQGNVFSIKLGDGDDRIDLRKIYLDAFPPGTNNIFRVRAEHDCSCCLHFIKNIGRAVVVNPDSTLDTIWNVEGLEHPFDVVAKTLHEAVSSKFLDVPFRVSEREYSKEFNMEQLEDGKSIRWNHFYSGIIGKPHWHTDGAKESGEHRSHIGVFRRGMEEVTAEAITEVIGLIGEGMIYRGEEYLEQVEKFQALHNEYAQLKTDRERDSFLHTRLCWEGLARNRAIGFLLKEFSEDDCNQEVSVKKFEVSVMAPDTFQRPRPFVNTKMVEKANARLLELNLETAIFRRHATLKDVSVNDVKWANGKATTMMKNTSLLGGLLKDAIQEPAISLDKHKVEDIAVDDFMKSILPTAASIELLFEGRHKSNLMNVTAPVHADAGRLFKWGNNFAWSYNGNIADSDIRKAVIARGGSVSGVFRFSHQWNHPGERNASLMDLHVFLPAAKMHTRNSINNEYGHTLERVGWNNRQHIKSGGIQDVDYVDAAPVGYIPVENITFPDIKKMPEGQYVCKIHNWKLRNPTSAGFRAEIEVGGRIYSYHYKEALKNNEWITVATVTLKDGIFTVESHLPVDEGTGTEEWGMTTGKFVPVQTIMHSPNFWNGEKTGNEHHFFIMEGCKNPETARGFYNEFLRPELHEDRKVFEVLAGKLQCEPSDDQLAGLGFSSTQRNAITARVKTNDGKQKFVNITF